MAEPLRISAECFQPSATMIDTRLWTIPFVYIIRANRKQRRTQSQSRYKKGGSRILYIGLTEKLGSERSSHSLAGVAGKAFNELHGVRYLGIHLARCARRRNVNSARQLESGLLRTFLDLFGHLPYYNRNKGAKPTKRAQFTRRRLETIIMELS
jgi:hypothetical protein